MRNARLVATFQRQAGPPITERSGGHAGACLRGRPVMSWDFKGMAAQITDDHIATFATEVTWDGLADALIDKYGASRSGYPTPAPNNSPRK
jgi:hypothetical protein